MKNSIFAAGFALAAMIGASANAATITLSTFEMSDFNVATAGGIVEDFEGYNGQSTPWSASTVTSVGTFTSNGGTGTGSVCNAQSGGQCQSLAVNSSSRSGQGNIVPIDGSTSLSSNDTFGIIWNVFTANNGLFSRIVFAVGDAADINGTRFTIETGSGDSAVSTSFTGASNNNERLVVIDLAGSFRNVSLSMFNTDANGYLRSNDGFTLDGATAVAAVPLPAGGLLILTGLGALAAMRKRRAAV